MAAKKFEGFGTTREPRTERIGIEEIEALQAIMMDEVNVKYDNSGQPIEVDIVIKPATAQNIEEQHVRVTLVVNLPQRYPDEPPDVILRNPRGIDDDVLQLIKIESTKKCEKFIGSPVIYELTELVREKLTANNTPSCPCAICLFYFTEKDHFTKTPCFHYFHSNCLGRYILNCEDSAAAEEKENQQPLWMAREKRQLLCPICRESMDSLREQINGHLLISNPPPEESNLLEDFCATSPDIVALQAKMASLYLLQKSKGGIIDLEEEKKKFLVSASLSVIENQDEAPNEQVEESPQTSVSRIEGNKMANQKPSNNGQQTNTNKKSGDSGTRNQGKKENSSNQTWWNGRNKHSHRRGGYRNANGYSRRQTYSYSDQPQMVESTQNQQLEHKNTNNIKFQKHSGADKHNQGRYKNFDSKPSSTKYTNHTDEKNSGNEVELEKVPGNDGKNMSRGLSYRSYNRGVKAKANGPPPGYADLDLTVNFHASS